MTSTLSLAAALSLAACAADTVSATAPHEGPVALGQTAAVGGPRVTPLRVVEDSRCPAGVACVWAGRVTVAVRIVAGRQRIERDLTVGAPVQVADGALRLTRVTPERRTDRAPQPGDYRFTFTFQGGR